MKPRTLLGIVALGTLTLAGGLALAHEEKGRSEEAACPMQGMMAMMRGMHGSMGQGGMMGGMMHGMPGSREADRAERPLITLALENKTELGLSAEQVRRLEALRSGFQKEAIRRSADMQIAEVELGELLRQDPVELGKVETALKRLEGLRTEQRLARLKAIEQGKAVLTLEQRQKLEALGRQAAGMPMREMMGQMGPMGGMMGPSGPKTE